MRTNIIHNESCLDTMARMGSQSVDLVITSPPYNMNLRIRNGKYCSRQVVENDFSNKYSEFSDNMPIDEFYDFHCQVLRELLRVSELVFYNIQIVTGSKRAFFKMIGTFSDKLKDIIVWDKGAGQPAMHEQVLNRGSEFLLVFDNDYPISRQFRNKGRFERGTLEDIWRINRTRKSFNGNKATFPSELVEKILSNFSDEEDIIYDPFMGTGTTAIGAKKLQRQFLGSEIDQELINVAYDRIDNEDQLSFRDYNIKTKEFITDKKYLKNREGYWYFYRRQPHTNLKTKISLKTKNLQTAQQRRDKILVKWEELMVDVHDAQVIQTLQKRMENVYYE